MGTRTFRILACLLTLVPLMLGIAPIAETYARADSAPPPNHLVAIQGSGIEFDILVSEIVTELPGAPDDERTMGSIGLDRVVLQTGEREETPADHRQYTSLELVFVEQGNVELVDTRSAYPLDHGEHHLLSRPEGYELVNSGNECASILRLRVGIPTPMGGAFGSAASGPQLPQVGCGESVSLMGWTTSATFPMPAQLFIANVTIQSGLNSWARVHAGPTALVMESGMVSTSSDSGEVFLGPGSVMLTPGSHQSILTGRGESRSLVVGVVGVPGQEGVKGTSYLSEKSGIALGWDSAWRLSSIDQGTDDDSLQLSSSSSSSGILTLESAWITNRQGDDPLYRTVAECVDFGKELFEDNPYIDDVSLSDRTVNDLLNAGQRPHEARTLEFRLTTPDGRFQGAPFVYHIECVATNDGNSIAYLGLSAPEEDFDAILQATDTLYWSLP